ncbi:MAG: helix-turn-helix transcriptional regulator [Succinivibrio sp.]|nr:helix-turn-helix transcriptional regulator [Succinivibrio sp.]
MKKVDAEKIAAMVRQAVAAVRGQDGFCMKLLGLIRERGLSDVEVYKKAHLDRRYFSKLRSERSHPSRRTVMALCLALELTEEAAVALMRSAGYAFCEVSLTDALVRCFLRGGVYDVDEANACLYDLGEEILGRW